MKKPPNEESGSSPARPKRTAKAKVVDYLSRREHATLELQRKLQVAGYSEQDTAEAIQWAQQLKLQSDERFAQSLKRRRAPTLGDRAIRAELDAFGLKALSAPTSEDDFAASEEDRAFDWFRKHYLHKLQALESSDLEYKQHLFALKSKAFQALSRRGFEIRNIDRAWKRLVIELQSEQ